jgi:hypothetical protein
MHKNRIIIALGILILLLTYYFNFTPSTKKFLIGLSAVAIVVLAFMIERKGFFSLQWRNKNTTTSVARTYVEHDGNKNVVSETEVISVTNSAKE